jgi:CRISPR-associated protein Cas8b/Csh1 subtype I-B
MLVGEISWHQDQVRDIGRPLDSKVSGDQLSKNSLERAITSALENAKLYAQESDYASQQDLLFPETVDKLLSTTEKMPTKWEIDKREMQFCYVLGHAHGRRSMPVAFDLLDEDSSTETESAEESTAN